MSALGQKQTSRSEISMSALPPKADIGVLYAQGKPGPSLTRQLPRFAGEGLHQR
jgi:hypothetical protein